MAIGGIGPGSRTWCLWFAAPGIGAAIKSCAGGTLVVLTLPVDAESASTVDHNVKEIAALCHGAWIWASDGEGGQEDTMKGGR